MFKCFVNEHDDDCRNCLRIIDWIDDDEKWLCLVVEFNDEFINRNIIERDLEIDVQLFEKLNDEILILIIFKLNNKLFQTTFKILTRFSFKIMIRKTFFDVVAFLFNMIRRSIIEFITYKTFFRNENWKFITRSRVNQKFMIVTIKRFKFAMILFVDKIVIMKMITIDNINVLKIRVILFVDWFVIDDIVIMRIDQI
jgi:hypothetical protein